jgi:hypothetical protein
MFALHFEQARTQVKDQVVSRVGEGPGDADPQFDGLSRDYSLGNGALLVRIHCELRSQ